MRWSLVLVVMILFAAVGIYVTTRPSSSRPVPASVAPVDSQEEGGS